MTTTTKKEEKNEIVPVHERFTAISNVEELGELIAENFGEDAEEALTPSVLEQIRVPSGGGLSFQVKQGGELVDELKELRGVVLHERSSRAYYIHEMGEGEDDRPDCFSTDGKTGYGVLKEGDEPCVRDCSTCPMAQFGSADKGSGQKCKSAINVMLLREGAEEAMLPSVLKIPSASIKQWRKAKQTMLVQGASPSRNVMSFTLRGEKNSANIAYAEIVPKCGRKMKPEEIGGVTQYRSTIVGAMPVGRQLTNAQPAAQLEDAAGIDDDA